jgi:hypothetical protein
MDTSGSKYSVDLPSKLVGDGYDEKYLLVHIVERDEWIVVSRRKQFHSQIFKLWKSEQASFGTFNIHGGGILCIENGVIRTFGSSGGYGRVDQEGLQIVRSCLETIPEFQVGKIEATDYIRE